MKLFSLIKSVCVFVGIIVVSNMYSMELEKQDKYVLLEKKLFNFVDTAESFVREFPLMSLKLVKYRHTRCDKEVQNKIHEKFIEKGNEFRRIMFYQGEVIGNVLINDRQLYKGFLNVPMKEIHKVFENGKWALEICNDKALSAEKVPYFIWSLTVEDSEKQRIKEKLLEQDFFLTHNSLLQIDIF